MSFSVPSVFEQLALQAGVVEGTAPVVCMKLPPMLVVGLELYHGVYRYPLMASIRLSCNSVNSSMILIDIHQELNQDNAPHHVRSVLIVHR